MAFHDLYEPEPNSGCWLWTGACNWNGYGFYKRAGKTSPAHRVAFAIAFPDIDLTGKVVMHKCDNRVCVNPDHLAVGTQAENIQDMRRKGRGRPRKGEKHPMAILTEADVRAIRQSKASLNEEARRYGVVRYAIWAIRNGRNWKHVSGE